MRYLLILLSFLILTSCYKEEVLTPKLIDNPKGIINNTSGWYVSYYAEADKDSTSLFSKYSVSFSEDATCAERVKFISPLSEVYAIWDTYDYVYGTVMRIWTPGGLGFYNLDGEWNFNKLSKDRIKLFRVSENGEVHQLIFQKL